MSDIGKVFPSEKFSFRDPETGAEITQYTRVGETNRTLYFTNRPYSPDGERVVFLSDRGGARQMFLLELKSGKIVQLTDGECGANVSNCVHPARPEMYFRTEQALFRVNYETFKTEELLRPPEGFRIGILNLNAPPWLAFEMIERLPQTMAVRDGRAVPAPGALEGHFMRPRSLLYRLNVDSGKLECVWGELAMLTHTQVSPTNPDLIIYSDFSGYGRDRCYFIDMRKRTKTAPRPAFPETEFSRAGHESFTRKGNLYAQWMEGDLDEEGDHQLCHVFRDVGGLPTREVPNAPFRKYRLPEQMGWLAHHFTMSSDERWGIHDRWVGAPSQEQNAANLSIFRHRDEEPQTLVERVCFHNGAKGDRVNLGAELTIDDRDEFATYTSFLEGRANVCQVRLAPFIEKILRKT